MSSTGPTSAFESETFGQNASFRLDQPVGSMSISPSGRDVVLASKEGLHIIDLDSPWSLPRYLPHRTPWEVADVQWSPFASKAHWVISTSNQKALVWNLATGSSDDAIEYVLHAHTRAITDINFAAKDPNKLATCAVDSFVHVWDLQCPLRPVQSFSDWFAGATQVKWSRQDEHVIASSHDKFLHIWDTRFGAKPTRTIEAHGTKIYGVDWNRFYPNKIVTCSLDRTVKFWNCDSQIDEPERVIETPFPVWRARHTPFGWGLLAMPQRASNDLHLYDRRQTLAQDGSAANKSVNTFTGHKGQVKEFLWRARGTITDGIDFRDFQLVSWAQDGELRLHRLDPQVYSSIGYVKGESKPQKINYTRRGARYISYRDETPESLTPVEPALQDSTHAPSFSLQIRSRTNTNIGMSKLPVSKLQGWVGGTRQLPRQGMHGRVNQKQVTNPITWLKNVNIGLVDADTLAEEVKQVGLKFKKVEFEVADIRHRRVVISLWAPWIEHQSPIYIRADMRFPKLYPHDASAVISIQKTGSIDNTLHQTLSQEIRFVAEAYRENRKGCLEAIIRYLLREQTMTEIVAWVMNDTNGDSKILDGDPIVDDISSDEDDERLEGRGTVDTSANAKVPARKGCGGMWSEAGLLVCFFPDKSKVKDTVLALDMSDLVDPQSSKVFERFGQLRANSPSRKGSNGAEGSDGESDYSRSDSSSTSSDTSSTSSDGDLEIHDGLLPYKNHLSGVMHRSRSLDHSNRSTTLGGKLQDTKKANVVILHDFSDLLPSKVRLAREYRISGSPKDICSHNALVASTAGMHDIASMWTLVGFIMEERVPLKLAKVVPDNSIDSVWVVAKRFIQQRQRQGHEVGPNASPDQSSHRKQSGQIRWGQHPLGSSYLISAILNHLENAADIQMLAMLSCVFASSRIDSLSLNDVATGQQSAQAKYFPSATVAESMLKGSRARISPQLKQSTARNSLSRVLNESTRARRLSIGLGTSIPGRLVAHPREPSFASRAASIYGDDVVGDASTGHSASVSLSTSPEGNRPSRRNPSTLAFPASHASLSALSHTFSHSPPTNISTNMASSSLKKYSPSGSLTPGHWVSAGLFGGSGRSSKGAVNNIETTENQKSSNIRSSMSMNSLKSGARDGTNSRASVRSTPKPESLDLGGKAKQGKRRIVIKTSLQNQDVFDLDGFASRDLLEPEMEARMQAYRINYAHLLDMWQLYPQKIEILKYNNSSDYPPKAIISSAKEIAKQPPIADRRRRRTITAADVDKQSGLQIRRCCSSCSEILAAIEKNGIPVGWHCVNHECSRSLLQAPTRSSCSICCMLIRGLSVPCIQCGHITCASCADEWFNHAKEKHRRSTNESGMSRLNGGGEIDQEPEEHQLCPSGCGCMCPMLNPGTMSVQAPDESQLAASSRSPSIVSFRHKIQAAHSNIQKTSTINAQQPQTHLQNIMSEHGPDRAISAFLSLTRSRSISGTNKDNSSGGGSSGHTMSIPVSTATRTSSVSFVNVNANANASTNLTVGPMSGTSSLSTESIISPPSQAQSHTRDHEHSSRKSFSSGVNSGGLTAIISASPEDVILSRRDMAVDDNFDHVSRAFTSDITAALGEDSEEDEEDPLPQSSSWAGQRIASLGRGIGAGLSRGLSTKTSDSTIRKAARS